MQNCKGNIFFYKILLEAEPESRNCGNTEYIYTYII